MYTLDNTVMYFTLFPSLSDNLDSTTYSFSHTYIKNTQFMIIKFHPIYTLL